MQSYLQDKIKLRINKKAVTFNFIGKEYEGDIVRCYLEVEHVKSIESFSITNSVLFDLQKDQQNIVKTNINSKNKKINKNIKIEHLLKSNFKGNDASFITRGYYSSFVKNKEINNKENDNSFNRNNELPNINEDCKYQQNDIRFLKKIDRTIDRSFFYDENNKPIIRPIELKKNYNSKKYQNLLNYSKQEWEEITEDVFSQIFKKSAVKRTKYQGLIRNINFVSKNKNEEPAN